MRPFRFRAQIVLELRRRQEDAARTALARQRAETARLQTLADEAVRVIRTARATMSATIAAGVPHAQLEWHRSWILKLTRDSAARRAAVEAGELATARAAAVLGTALQKRRVLERLRERALRRYTLESERELLKGMNELASLRHFAQAPDLGGQPDEHDSDDRRRGSRADALPDLELDARRDGRGPAGPQRVLEPAGDAAPAPGSDPAAS